jgi:hypothetical protein
MKDKLIQKLSEQYTSILMEFIDHTISDELIATIEDRFLQSLSPIIGATELIAYDGIYKYQIDNKIIEIFLKDLGDFKDKGVYLAQLANQII